MLRVSYNCFPWYDFSGHLRFVLLYCALMYCLYLCCCDAVRSIAGHYMDQGNTTATPNSQPKQQIPGCFSGDGRFIPLSLLFDWWVSG